MLTGVDTGTGISEENLPNIFEPYFSTKSREYNSGLGLASFSSIVKQHHGRINVESKPGLGTTFRLFSQPFIPDKSRAKKRKT